MATPNSSIIEDYSRESYNLSGAHGSRALSSTTAAILAVAFTIAAVPTMPIFLGYVFGSFAIIFAAVVLSRVGNAPARDLPVIAAWFSLGISLVAMIGYLAYMLTLAPNYM